MSTPGGIYNVRKISEYLQSEFKSASQVVPVRALHHDDLIDKFHELADAFLTSSISLSPATLQQAEDANNNAVYMTPLRSQQGWLNWIEAISIATLNTSDKTIIGAINEAATLGGGGGSSIWGSIIGTLSNQTDLQLVLDSKVNDTGNETIAGVKTFSSFPVSPSSAPTTDYQFANKKYVDDNSTGLYNTAIINKKNNLSLVSGSNDFTFDTPFNDTAYLILVKSLDASGNFNPYQIPEINRTTTGFRIIASAIGRLDYLAFSISGGVTDITSVNWANVTDKPTIPSSHTELSAIGTNTHAQIDTHIADTDIHFEQGDISIPASQVSDFDTEVGNNADVSDSFKKTTDDSDDVTEGSTNLFYTSTRQTTALTEYITTACSDETTDLETGTGVTEFQMPFAMTLTAVRATVTTAPVGSTIEVDINEGGVSILSTVISIDVSEKTSTSAATAPVISDSSLADGAVITIDIDQIGSSTAGTGLKVQLIGYRT